MLFGVPDGWAPCIPSGMIQQNHHQLEVIDDRSVFPCDVHLGAFLVLVFLDSIAVQRGRVFWLFPSMANRDTFYCIFFIFILYNMVSLWCFSSVQDQDCNLFAHKMCSCWPISGHHLWKMSSASNASRRLECPSWDISARRPHIFFPST